MRIEGADGSFFFLYDILGTLKIGKLCKCA